MRPNERNLKIYGKKLYVDRLYLNIGIHYVIDDDPPYLRSDLGLDLELDLVLGLGLELGWLSECIPTKNI